MKGETRNSITAKLARGTFAATFFLACLAALEMEGLRLTSYISVPMQVPDGRTIGVLSVVMAESGRRFTAADVELAHLTMLPAARLDL